MGRQLTSLRVEEVKGLLRAGSAEQAWGFLQDLQDQQPDAAQLWYLRSLAAQTIGRGDDAQSSIDRAIALDPRPPYFHVQAARLAASRGEHAAATLQYEMLLQREPALVLAWVGLGSSRLSQGHTQQARSALRRAVELGSNSGSVLLDLARLEQQGGQAGEALALARRAAAIPEAAAEALLLSGEIHQRRGEPDAARRAFESAGALHPEDLRPPLAVASLLWEQGQWQASADVYANASRRHPGSLRAAFGARLSLPHVYESEWHLQASRQRFSQAIDGLEAIGPAPFCKPAALLMQDLRWTNFLLAYQGQNDLSLQSRYGDFVHAVVRDSMPQWLIQPVMNRRAGVKIRVGFASRFFYDCTVGRYFSPWVLGLDPRRFDVYVYAANDQVSPITRRVEASVAGFRRIAGSRVLSVAQHIREDQLDILIYPELGMHADTFALACLRLARVQCAAWGHPTTTGLPTIDAFLSCDSMEPEDAQSQYRERLLLLPGLGTCYAAPGKPAPEPELDLGLPRNRTLYLIPQSSFKIHPDNDDLVAQVLAQDGNGMVVLFALDSPAVVDALLRRLKQAFARHGLALDQRLLVLPGQPHDRYLSVNRQCQVMLDTVHWSGGNTALDALACGLPIVTLPGGLMRGRQSAAMLKRLGLDELIATSREDYVQKAVRLGTDPEWRTHFRERVLAARDKLFDDPKPVRTLTQMLCCLAEEGVERTPTRAGE